MRLGVFTLLLVSTIAAAEYSATTIRYLFATVEREAALRALTACSIRWQLVETQPNTFITVWHNGSKTQTAINDSEYVPSQRVLLALEELISNGTTAMSQVVQEFDGMQYYEGSFPELVLDEEFIQLEPFFAVSRPRQKNQPLKSNKLLTNWPMLAIALIPVALGIWISHG